MAELTLRKLLDLHGFVRTGRNGHHENWVRGDDLIMIQRGSDFWQHCDEKDWGSLMNGRGVKELADLICPLPRSAYLSDC